MFVSVVFYPIAAGVGAAHAGAGWLTVFFVPLGLALGIGIICIGRILIYSITRFGVSCVSKMRRNWMQQVFVVPFLLFNVISPYAIICAGVFGIWLGSIWLVRQLL